MEGSVGAEDDDQDKDVSISDHNDQDRKKKSKEKRGGQHSLKKREGCHSPQYRGA